MVENNATAFFSVDTNYRYRSFNRGHAELMKSKYKANIEIGKNILDYINVNLDREKVKKDLYIPLKGEESTLSPSCSEKNNLSYPYLGKSYFDIRGADNKFIGIAVVEKETSEPKQDEELTKKQTQAETSPTGHQSIEETPVMSEQIYPTPVEEGNDGIEAIHNDKVQLIESKLEIALPERKCTEQSPVTSEEIYSYEHTKAMTSTHLNSMLKVIRDVNRFIISDTDRQCFIQRCCDILIEARGYEKAWILLIDKDKNFISAASAGSKEKLPILMKDLQWDNNYHCVKQVLEKQQLLVVYSDVKSQCRGCPLADTHCQSSAFISQLKYDGIVYGVMAANTSLELAVDRNEHDFFMELTGNIAFALARIDSSERLEENMRKYRELTESVSDMFFAMDDKLRCTYWNEASEELTGILAKDALGKHLIDVFPDVESTGQVQAICRRVIGTGQPQHFTVDYPSGKNIIYEISVYPKGDGVTVSVVTKIVRGGIFRGIRG